MKSRLFKGFILAGLLMILVSGCGKDEGNLISLEEYITQNNITLTKTTPEGIGVVIELTGTAGKPSSNANVTVKYRGLLTNGSTFDSNSSGATFNLQGVITGWTLGIPEFGKGGKGTLYIPSELGYGSRGQGSSIPPNADLIFDVELIDFN